MLRLFLEEEPDKSRRFVKDVEMYFQTEVNLKFDESENKFLKLIEQGHFIDDNQLSFIDRFGYKLPLDFLSTGCKAALCALHCGENVINLVECGINALEIIVTELKDGYIYIPYHDGGFYRDNFDGKIDVWLDDYRFTNLKRLNYYLLDERPFKPDMKMSGIELVK